MCLKLIGHYSVFCRSRVKYICCTSGVKAVGYLLTKTTNSVDHGHKITLPSKFGLSAFGLVYTFCFQYPIFLSDATIFGMNMWGNKWFGENTLSSRHNMSEMASVVPPIHKHRTDSGSVFRRRNEPFGG